MLPEKILTLIRAACDAASVEAGRVDDENAMKTILTCCQAVSWLHQGDRTGGVEHARCATRPVVHSPKLL